MAVSIQRWSVLSYTECDSNHPGSCFAMPSSWWVLIVQLYLSLHLWQWTGNHCPNYRNGGWFPLEFGFWPWPHSARLLGHRWTLWWNLPCDTVFVGGGVAPAWLSGTWSLRSVATETNVNWKQLRQRAAPLPQSRQTRTELFVSTEPPHISPADVLVRKPGGRIASAIYCNADAINAPGVV